MGKRNELLSSAEKCTALWLTWALVGYLIADELDRLLSQSINVRAGYSDVDYWCCEFSGYCMDVATQERLLDAIASISGIKRLLACRTSFIRWKINCLRM